MYENLVQQHWDCHTALFCTFQLVAFTSLTSSVSTPYGDRPRVGMGAPLPSFLASSRASAPGRPEHVPDYPVRAYRSRKGLLPRP